MNQQNSKLQKSRLQKSLENIVSQASRQKLLPKILWNADRQFGSKKMLSYQKSVRKQYENELKNPIKYDPQGAKSDRQKFRQKVVKLMCNELDIQYFQKQKLKDKTVILYKGSELQQSKISTKNEFEMFKNFNQKRFKQTYSNIFQDRLELAYQNIYQNKTSKRCNTLHMLQSKPEISTYDLKIPQIRAKSNKKPLKTYISESTERPFKKDILVQSARKKVISFNQKKFVGNPIQHNEQEAIIRIVKQIGGYSNRFDSANLCLTRQSINRWLKSLYEKPLRIIDYLEIKEVINLEEFRSISKRLRVMPNEHLLFMAFLYYDGNNDGYICDYDLQRLNSLGLIRPVLAQDYKKIKQSNIKKLLSRKEAYLQLYKLSQITQTMYFQWRKTKQQKLQGPSIELKMKNSLLSSKKKHIFLDFPSFSSIYGFDKPFLWYDLMHSFSGLNYQGLKYD